MVNLEIDGKAVSVDNGATVMDAATKLGVFVPHFCYHKKLSIAANCRMCLVQVEKAPKPLPACATPATEGMKVYTQSEQAKTAQKGVMEFLLINHPLDCPICDQGGECQLQDLAVGYGGSSSRYQEEKRVVFHKNIGPLVSAEEMARCIHCTRCVRFGQEIAGTMELGMAGRGEHSEILSFVGRSVDSELSGNMIDVCPVGALTSKPFRFAARTWELSRRKTVAAHDGLGSNIVAQVKGEQVLRVVPMENEAVNECWISDRDRFSYEGLNSVDRLTKPMIRKNGAWQETSWHDALQFVAKELKAIAQEDGGACIAALTSPQQTLEEQFLLAKLVRGLGSENIDYRARQRDFALDGSLGGVPWLGLPVADIAKLGAVLIVGSTLRKEQPLLANRFRQAAKKGQLVTSVHVVDDDWLMPVAAKSIVLPSKLVSELAAVAVALADLRKTQVAAQVKTWAGGVMSAQAKAIAEKLAAKQGIGVFLGAYAEQHPQASALAAIAQNIATLADGGTHGFFTSGPNAAGAALAQARPLRGGDNAVAMFAKPKSAYVLMGVEPALDCADNAAAVKALQASKLVVALSAYKGDLPSYASVLLPVTPFTETAGTYVSYGGRVQRFNGVVKPMGDSRPAWKVLRVLGNIAGLDGFEFESVDDVRAAIAPNLEQWAAEALDNEVDVSAVQLPVMPAQSGLERIAEIPIYGVDPIVRRAVSLQLTADAKSARLARMNRDTAAKIGAAEGQVLALSAGAAAVQLQVKFDAAVPSGAVRVAAHDAATAALGNGTLAVNAVALASERAA